MYLAFLGWYGARYFGDEWRRDLLLGLLGPYAVLCVVAPLYERHVRRQVDTADPELIAELRRTDPDFEAFMQDRPRFNERTDWSWRATDLAAGIALAFYPPLVYTLWRYRELQGHTPFDGIAVALMLAGCAGYLFWRRRRLRHYQCPSCELEPVRLHGEKIRYACARCGVTWQLGSPMIGDGRAAAPPS